MPNCFSLTRKSDLAAGPVSLNKIDEEMCAYFSTEVHPTKWYHQWYNIIGFSLAMDCTFDELIQRFETDALNESKNQEDRDYYHQLVLVIKWLNDNFVVSAWVEIGRRS